jgi:hypothetical protein
LGVDVSHTLVSLFLPQRGQNCSPECPLFAIYHANHRQQKCELWSLREFENNRRRNELSVHCALNSVDESMDIQRLGLNLGYSQGQARRHTTSLLHEPGEIATWRIGEKSNPACPLAFY